MTAEPLRAATTRPSPATGDIGVLVAGGNALSRRAVRTLLSVDARFVVLGEARTRVDLLNLAAQLRPTVVVLDPDLPQGVLPALADLMATHPLPVVVYGDARLANPTAAAELRAAGAVDVVVRDSGMDDLRACLHLASRIRVIRHPRGRLNRTSAASHDAVPLIVIGASTGGPSAVSAVLSALPGDLCAAVMVVQHMPAGFLSGLAGWLNGSCRLPVSLGADGDLLRPGEVVVCPGDLDSLIERAAGPGPGRLRCVMPDLPAHHVPSVDRAFESVASVLGRRAIGVLLTGMGRDGADGMASLHAAGATTIAQDEDTSAIYGMPRAAVAAGVVDEILPLPEIAAALMRLVGAPERSLR
jgi:two-component system, chemotaxis family, protein-glutamate methylesterase/glutaminase